MNKNVFSNVTSLTVKACNYYDEHDNAATAGERFFRAATLLASGNHIGLQVFAEKNSDCSAIAFSDSDNAVTCEDYAWIFHGCADVEAASSDTFADLFSGDRKVYALIPLDSSGEDDKDASAARFAKNSSEQFSELLEMMVGAGAAIRIVAESAGNQQGAGSILFSLTPELPLRLRTVLSMAFPGTEAKELSELKQTESFVDGGFIKCGVAGLLNALMRMRKKNKEDYSEYDVEDWGLVYSDDELDEDDDYTPSTSIEKLDLSVRSYNCLKRAGITNVEKLRAMSDDELMRVRNLGRKCIAEIRQKLAETAETKEPTKPSLPEGLSYMEMLDGLIGLGEVKAQVKKLAAFARMKQTMANKESASVPMVLNMEFIGNPGTAKTTVARITAGILHEIGLLPTSELVEVGRADLVAKYTGQTADKVKEVFQKAKGKLLFIDEAYALTDCWENSYGDEAISTIVQEMENNREDTVVIFAGYPDKMNEFFSRNPGLRSRVPFTIRFSDYSAEEMAQIVEAEAKKRGFSLMPEAQQRVLDICSGAAGNPDAGNGRFCRNLAESAVLSYAERIFGQEESTDGCDFALIGADFSLPSALREVRQSRTIGFCA